MKPVHFAACAAVFTCLSAPASAHVTYERAEATAGAAYKGVLRVPHGCKGEATHTVRVTLPDEIVGVKPMPKAGWKITTRVGAYAAPFNNHGRAETEGVREIVWSGGSLEDAHVDEFAFFGQVTAAAGGRTIYTPVVQECANGAERWTEIPAEGQRAKAPAPALRVQMAQASGHQHGAPATTSSKTYRAGALTIDTPWTRATPKGAPVAGGYVKITNAGKEADTLVGGSFDLSRRVEVHEMKMEGGMMKMRELADGLPVAPGGSVELKPGGFHLMFLELKEPLVPGKPVKGRLVFEKAGPVDVEFAVAPLGAREAPGAGASDAAGGGHDHH